MQFNRSQSSSSPQDKLIVDFPSGGARSTSRDEPKVCQKQKEGAKHANNKQRALPMKSVRFSEDSTVVYIHCPKDQEVSYRWYTEEAMQGFQHKMWRDAIRQSAVYITTKSRDPNAILPKEEAIKCVGVVHDDIRARYKGYKLNRKMHSVAILGEQDRQLEGSGRVCSLTLATFSMALSQADKEKATKIAYLSESLGSCIHSIKYWPAKQLCNY